MEQEKSERDYRHLTEREVLNLPKVEHKELFLLYRMPEGYDPKRDRKTIMFLESMFRDGYELGAHWQKNHDADRIEEKERKIVELECLKRLDKKAKDFMKTLYKEKFEDQSKVIANLQEELEQVKGDIPEWVDVSNDDVEKEDFPSDFDPVLCLTENGDYQVLMLVHYTSSIIDSEWDTVGLKRNTSYPIVYVKKWQYINEPKALQSTKQ